MKEAGVPASVEDKMCKERQRDYDVSRAGLSALSGLLPSRPQNCLSTEASEQDRGTSGPRRDRGSYRDSGRRSWEV